MILGAAFLHVELCKVQSFMPTSFVSHVYSKNNSYPDPVMQELNSHEYIYKHTCNDSMAFKSLPHTSLCSMQAATCNSAIFLEHEICLAVNNIA